jgi:hypothetical protein
LLSFFGGTGFEISALQMLYHLRYIFSPRLLFFLTLSSYLSQLTCLSDMQIFSPISDFVFTPLFFVFWDKILLYTQGFLVWGSPIYFCFWGQICEIIARTNSRKTFHFLVVLCFRS